MICFCAACASFIANDIACFGSEQVVFPWDTSKLATAALLLAISQFSLAAAVQIQIVMSMNCWHLRLLHVCL